MKKILIIIFCILLLSSCTKSTLIGDKLTDKATEQQQEQVKQEVLKLLEQEYNQPFKIVDYSYEYGTHWKDKTCAIASMCPKEIYGVYKMKIETIETPNLSLNIRIEDDGKNFMDDFKKTYVPIFYCGALGSYYDDLRINKSKVNTDYLDKAEKYCDNRGQKELYERSKYIYLRNLSK
ncbi:hypothetical protein IBE48_04925 [Francisella philomiragia]|uniref:Lipoprotein n=1 Tax=Francisella philomiragia TaxID=28110 RepID=A0AAW3DAW8_9GAMM|nr:hypothetical protein [Francisella philomiragia]KFJ42525.1 putative lipoprotein [Francisella philomiragia]MBK2254012.1 hypothetical protein [Francisella philomiragia]MBK2272324.1 hypothetical protein [Francisella philomiragia]MBK2276166.1 hypothetical protein [Francisella philomiragia]MBK2280113.1 hypothetical protein [Francisella philomiragia]